MFELSEQEEKDLVSQNVIPRRGKLGRGGRRYRPYAFTEQGVAMRIADANRWTGSTSFPKESSAEKPSAFAAWITAGEVGQIIQATGGWLKP